MYIYIHIYLYICMYINMCIHTYSYIFVYLYILTASTNVSDQLLLLAGGESMCVLDFETGATVLAQVCVCSNRCTFNVNLYMKHCRIYVRVQL